MAVAPDITSGNVTLTSGLTAFTTTAANMVTRKVQAGDEIRVKGFVLTIGSVTGENTGELAENCPAGAAGTSALRLRYQGDGSRVAAQARNLIDALGALPDRLPPADNANSGKVLLFEATANGANKITVEAPAALGADRTFTLPDLDYANVADLFAKWTKASAAGPASLLFHEDADNGTNKITLKAAADLPADVDFILEANGADLLTRWTKASAAGPAQLLFHEDSDFGTNKVTLKAGANLPADVDFILDAAGADLLTRWTKATSAGPASLDFYEDTDNGTNRIRILPPAALAADYAFQLAPGNVTLDSFIIPLLNSTSLTSAQSAIGVRTVLAANRTYYVGYNLGAVSISIATPAVVTKVAHGLGAGGRVAFAILPNTKAATISIASPAVVTMANSFVAGQPIKFATTGRLPNGVTPGTTYYVLATGLSGAGFQFAATPGGAAINTTSPTVTISNASPGVVTETAHGRSAGDPVVFATTGALPTGLTAGTVYFIKTVLNANTYTVAATPEGTAINTSSAGSGTHTNVQHGTHYLSETGALPTGVTEGQDYYVLAAGLTADAFQFSATAGGAAINTSGSTSGTITARTGSDSNDGLTNSAAGALLTPQKAIDLVAALDRSIYNVGVELSAGVFLSGMSISGWGPGAGTVTVNGVAWNTIIATTSARCVTLFDAALALTNVKMTTGGTGAGAMFLGFGGKIIIGSVEFGSVASGTPQIHIEQGARLDTSGNYFISGGGGGFHIYARYNMTMEIYARTITLIGRPAFSSSYISTESGAIGEHGACTFVGYGTGKRFNASDGGVLKSGGGGASYFPGDSAGTGTNFSASPYGLYS